MVESCPIYIIKAYSMMNAGPMHFIAHLQAMKKKKELS